VLYLFPLFVLHDLRQSLAVTALNGVLAIVVGSVVYAYEGQRLRLAESLREVEEVRLVEARLREEAARAELAALQARINPHFFFNTLNTISALLPDAPAAAEEMVLRLAELFRYTFRVADAGPVPLSEELDFIRGYLEIERARFGGRLRVAWEVDPAARDARVPGLLLQPLVENAVAHGIAPLARGGTVTIRAGREDGRLAVEVEDDGAGVGTADLDLVRDDHGLGNVRRRLDALFGSQATLRILPGPEGRGTRARIAMPAMGASR
jgi:LytS/YehU family sensor histidine kinase